MKNCPFISFPLQWCRRVSIGYLAACLFLLLAASSQAQKPCPVGDCPCLEAKARNALSASTPDFQTAIEKYQAFALCNPAKRAYVDSCILAVFGKIQQLQKKAEANEKKAITQKRRADKNAQEAKALFEVADAQKRRAEAVLDKIYFYKDKFGLAYDKIEGQYGYIDKDLKTRIDFKYDEAFSFEDIGFARVKREYQGVYTYFLIDKKNFNL
jgi:hypothetical protein